jgi:hypothetical protein
MSLTRTTPEFESLLAYLSETPAVVEQMVGSLTDEAGRWKPTATRFSALENVCHLLDIEHEGYAVRIERLLREDGPTLKDIDGARLALERDYNKQNMATALKAFRRVRESNVLLLCGLSAEQLERAGTLETVGPITLGELLRMMRAHDEAHRREINELREELIDRRA